MSKVEDTIQKAKEKLPDIGPTAPPQQKPQSSAQTLKKRLERGEVAFTILDVRDRGAFNASRLLGAVPMSIEDIPTRAFETLEPVREIYIYGDSDEQSAQAAAKLREAGYENVSELTGGLAAWKAIGGPTEGNAELGYDDSAAEYNVKARLDKHAEVSSKNV